MLDMCPERRQVFVGTYKNQRGPTVLPGYIPRIHLAL